MQSEDIKELAAALNKAQSEMMCASKDAKNPFFKSTYATLNSVWEAVKDALLNNGLTALQPIKHDNGSPIVQTIIMHVSGQYITGECPIICAKEKDPQALGSAITYARRYSLAAMLGVVTDEDDDAEKNMVINNKKSELPQNKPDKPTMREIFVDMVSRQSDKDALISRFDACQNDEERKQFGAEIRRTIGK
jgi:hypothetical protein